MAKQVELLIVGGGPIGLACALAAQKAGIDYLVVEKGCLVNSLYRYPINMTFFSTSERLEIGGVPFVSNNAKPTRPEALEYYRRVASSQNIHISLFEKVENIRPNDNGYTVITGKEIYHTRYIIIATGFYDIPNLLNIPGEDLAKVTHYYKDPHYYAMQDVLVVGASNSSVDAALETYRKGARVTMVVRDSKISDRVKYWVRPDVINRIEEGSIKAYFNSELVRIGPHDAELKTPEGNITIPNDFVLALTGYCPNFALLRKLGITLSEDDKLLPVHDPDTMETNVEGLYLAGVVCGGMDTHLWFIENSRDHADKIINHILAKSGN